MNRYPVNSTTCPRCRAIGDHTCRRPDGLPAGAATATEFDDAIGDRVVFSADFCFTGNSTVKASVHQTRAGVLVDEPLVHVTVGGDGGLSVAAARVLADALIAAAVVAERWGVASTVG